MTAFIAQLASAKQDLANARKSLATAVSHSAPLDAELAAKLEAHNPAAFAECAAKVEAITQTIPSLRAAVDTLAATHDELAEQACWKCRGTGVYTAPTTRLREGRAYCFGCGGDGRNAKVRKAASK